MSDPFDPDQEPAVPSRGRLVWDVVAFNFKLAADGIKDLLLSPLSLAALVAGLIAGGAEPDRYFRRLLAQGRRVEHWINLFGRRHKATSDQMLEPLQRRVFEEFARQPWLNRAGTTLGRRLDSVNASIDKNRRRERDAPSEGSSNDL
jgi:hypothetical protein